MAKELSDDWFWRAAESDRTPVAFGGLPFQDPKVEKTFSCNFCRKEYTLMLPQSGIDALNDGVLVQNAFPGLPAEDRELMISGMCAGCWELTFGPYKNE